MAPKIAPFSFGEEAIFAGLAAQITCMVMEGDLPMDVQWYFHGANVSTRLGISTVRVGQRTNLLVIDSVTPENGGQYTCRAANSAGVAEYSADLFVKGTVAPLLSTFTHPTATHIRTVLTPPSASLLRDHVSR